MAIPGPVAERFGPVAVRAIAIIGPETNLVVSSTSYGGPREGHPITVRTADMTCTPRSTRHRTTGGIVARSESAVGAPTAQRRIPLLAGALAGITVWSDFFIWACGTRCRCIHTSTSRTLVGAGCYEIAKTTTSVEVVQVIARTARVRRTAKTIGYAYTVGRSTARVCPRTIGGHRREGVRARAKLRHADRADNTREGLLHELGTARTCKCDKSARTTPAEAEVPSERGCPGAVYTGR